MSSETNKEDESERLEESERVQRKEETEETPGKTDKSYRTPKDTVKKALDKGISGLKDEFLDCHSYPSTAIFTSYNDVANENKNRFGRVRCIENTRVVLRNCNSDYIHANYITLGSNTAKYIVSQGPLDYTISDFWAMITQKNCKYIVMVCDWIEMGRQKCSKYYPNVNETTQYGPFTIHTLQQEMISSSTVLKTTIEVTPTSKNLTVTHYLLNSWPDRGLPRHSDDIFVILNEIRCSQTPVVFHCSTGVGRSATIMGIEYMLKSILNGISLPEDTLIASIRRYRASAISVR
ncbi:unnamed protein product [Bursaphelenchus okinawaensis]|uniref:Tyrosine phosphatase n=1 Tax=Bursaphelenchus okinawaensis TaxID=465554 RepID=A0A811LBA7_9BILA|nr:unnamed protein product [Bursaphelenchus okinawaensis]CAG9120217.1 unnamed protein product [Bursaphelenchus okinawaensis]